MGMRSNLPVSPFSRAEFANAVYRQVFLKRLSAMDARRAWENFEMDCRIDVLKPIEFPEGAWSRVVHLARSYVSALGVRTLDTLHVACALELRAGRFWTFDERQAKLAEAAGLDTGI